MNKKKNQAKHNTIGIISKAAGLTSTQNNTLQV
jgi:hypothetical protein